MTTQQFTSRELGMASLATEVVAAPAKARRHSRFQLAAKSAFDRIAATLLLLVLAIPMLVIALAVRLTSPGPAVFRQVRVGRDGQEFTIYKFRSMVTDAEARLAELREANEGAGLLFKMTRDPRVTRVGRLIRSTSLDELPQLWNVVRGEMSLVGPRPALPAEVADYSERERERLAVKPGVTGLWQVSGRSRLDWETSIGLDLAYVRTWSLRGDLVLLFRTLRAVLTRDGAV
ncbi:sugar transferase [Nocardioides sp.]|uniref:sugar transferase n=1 Tax=Nocardioides sp. TaxID=35761 RepID=UPI0039E2391E